MCPTSIYTLFNAHSVLYSTRHDFISALHCMQYVTVVTQARVVCLICTPEARGLRVDISGRPQVPVLQLLCNTSFAYNWLNHI